MIESQTIHKCFWFFAVEDPEFIAISSVPLISTNGYCQDRIANSITIHIWCNFYWRISISSISETYLDLDLFWLCHPFLSTFVTKAPNVTSQKKIKHNSGLIEILWSQRRMLMNTWQLMHRGWIVAGIQNSPKFELKFRRSALYDFILTPHVSKFAWTLNILMRHACFEQRFMLLEACPYIKSLKTLWGNSNKFKHKPTSIYQENLLQAAKQEQTDLCLWFAGRSIVLWYSSHF